VSGDGHPAREMDDQRFGMALRAARLKRGWTQAEVAARAGVGQTTVSRVERGFIDMLSVATLRRIAAVLEVRVALTASSRGSAFDRIAGAAHASLAEAAVAWLPSIGSWVIRPEVSFAHWGERGVVDLVAWHAATGTLLLVELKTLLVDMGLLLATLDRRHRLGHVIAEPFGWQPRVVSTLLIVAEGPTNRRRVADHRELLRAALPDDGRRVRAWLRAPVGSIRGLTFLSTSHPRTR